MNQISFHTYGRSAVSDCWPINYFTGVNRLYYVNQGTAGYVLNEKEYFMEEGCFYLFPSHLSVRFFTKNDIIFDHTFFDFIITPPFLLDQVLSFPGKNTLLLQALQLFHSILASFGRSEKTKQFLQSHFETMLFLFQNEIPYRQLEDDRIQKVLEQIHQNFCEPLSVSSFADQLHMDKTHFIRIFKEATGFTPYQYLKNHRMNTALGLLQNNVPVQTIAQICGYQSAAAFSSAFFQHFGQYPSKISLE